MFKWSANPKKMSKRSANPLKTVQVDCKSVKNHPSGVQIRQKPSKWSANPSKTIQVECKSVKNRPSGLQTRQKASKRSANPSKSIQLECKTVKKRSSGMQIRQKTSKRSANPLKSFQVEYKTVTNRGYPKISTPWIMRMCTWGYPPPPMNRGWYERRFKFYKVSSNFVKMCLGLGVCWILVLSVFEEMKGAIDLAIVDLSQVECKSVKNHSNGVQIR